MNRSHFNKGNKFVLKFDDPMSQPRVGKVSRNDGIGIGLLKKVIEVFFAIKRPKSFDERIPSKGSEFLGVFGLWGAELELSGHGYYWLLVRLKLFELYITKPNGLTFGLKRDVTMGQE